MPTLGVSGLYSSTEVQARIRELIKLAKEQGYLTFDDLNEALPEGVTDADELDLILTRLRRMEIDIIEASEVDRYKDGKKDADEEEEEEEGGGQQRLIFWTTRCGCISSRWGRCRCSPANRRWKSPSESRKPRAMVQKHISRFGFIARAHLDLAAKTVEGRERFDRVILDKKIESRERYMKNLPRLCKQVEQTKRVDHPAILPSLHVALRRKRSQKLRALQRTMAALAADLSAFYLQAESH